MFARGRIGHCLSAQPCLGVTRVPARKRYVLRRWLLLGLSCAGLLACSAVRPPVVAAGWLQAGSTPALGWSVSSQQLATLRPAIYPDGHGLPPGQGLAGNGARLYATQCASCHGAQGEGGTAPELVGGEGPLTRPDADKTLLTYWPYATTLFDTVARSMPPAAPGHLSADQLYALCAWLLERNGLWPADTPLDATGLASVRMPNRAGFIAHRPTDGP